MKRYVSLFIGCIVLAGILFSGCSSSKRHDRYVVVLSMDGFRSDYPDRAYTPTLDSLAKVGIRAAFQRNISEPLQYGNRFAPGSSRPG